MKIAGSTGLSCAPRGAIKTTYSSPVVGEEYREIREFKEFKENNSPKLREEYKKDAPEKIGRTIIFNFQLSIFNFKSTLDVGR